MQASTDIDLRITFSPAGLTLGATRLAPVPKASDRPAVDAERLETLFAVAFRRLPSDRDHVAIETASTHWPRGDKALANLRLVVADLPQLQTLDDVIRLKAAELLYDTGLRTADLSSVFEIDQPIAKSGQYDPDQPRVPAGSGFTSGRWTKLWDRFSAWLDAEVPEYDQDTGIEVGTQSRARAIVMNPLSVGVVGTAALLGSEALLPAAAVTGAAEAGGSTAAVVLDDTSIAANAARGAESQARVLEDMGFTRNTRAVTTSEGRAIPDALTDDASIEIKDRGYVSATKQVRIQTEAAKGSGRESILVTGAKTKISKQADPAFQRIIRRTDLGPH